MDHSGGRRTRRPQPATVLALLALVVSLSAGGAAVASHLVVRSADIVDGAVRTQDLADDAATGAKVKESSLAKVPNAAALNGLRGQTFRRVTDVQGTETVLGLRGLRIRYSCGLGDPGLRRPQLVAETTAENAQIHLRFTTGGEGSGTTFLAFDNDFDTSDEVDLVRNRIFGFGTILYNNPQGNTVTLEYSFRQGVECTAHGVAFGGR